MRKRMSPSSDSSISDLWRAKLTRAPLTTERSLAIASSRRTKPWSRTRIVCSGITSGVTATPASVTGLYVGASGFSYPSWRPGFYPAAVQPSEFLRYYGTRLPSVELNTTGYRLPAEELFDRWAAQTPPAFRFAVKMPPRGLRALGTFEERVRRLGDRLGPIRVVVPSARDDGLLELVLGSVDPALRYAFDFRHDSWAGVEGRLAAAGAVRVTALGDDAPFRYLRLR